MRVRGPVLQHNEGAVRIPHLSRCSPQLTLASSAASRRPLPHAPPCSIDAPFKAPCRRRRARPRALVRPRCCRRPRRRRPAPDTPYKHPLSLLLLPPICLSRRHRRHTALCVASACACVKNGGRGVWRARTAVTTSITLLPPPRQPPLLPGQNRLTCPCQALETPRLVLGEGPRGTRALDARHRRSPDPTETLAHRSSPRAGPRPLPSSAWIGFALPYSSLN